MYLSQVHKYTVLHASIPLIPPSVPKRNKKSFTIPKG